MQWKKANHQWRNEKSQEIERKLWGSGELINYFKVKLSLWKLRPPSLNCIINNNKNTFELIFVDCLIDVFFCRSIINCLFCNVPPMYKGRVPEKNMKKYGLLPTPPPPTPVWSFFGEKKIDPHFFLQKLDHYCVKNNYTWSHLKIYLFSAFIVASIIAYNCL